MKVINLFAGPGAGKSTTRAKVFARFKDLGINCEEVTEFAKDATWDENHAVLADQLFLLANQNRRQDRLRNKVDWCITDAPLLLGAHYSTPDYLPENFKNLIFEVWNTYENYNFFIRRTKPYMTSGRSQTEAQARDIDEKILTMLIENCIPFIELPDNDSLSETIKFLLLKI